MMKTLRILTAGALAAVLAACGSDSTGPGLGGGKSGVRVDLSGALGGRVDISGSALDRSKGTIAGFMSRADGETTLVVHAVDANDERGLAFVFLTPRTGTYNTADLCTMGGDDHRCVLISLTDQVTGGFYVLTSGRVTVSKFSSTRITGTFEGEGTGAGGDVLHFKDGRFDVEILDIGNAESRG